MSGAVLGVLAVTGAASVAIGRSVWLRETARSVSRLDSGARADPDPQAAVPAELWESLPDPVQRYLRFALPEERRLIQTARVSWDGVFRMRPDAGWVPFTADQHFTADPPGFVWDARMRMMPLVSVRVRDGYWQETGSMLARLGGVVPLVQESGAPETAQSALARWLGETVWFPAALLPGQSVYWESVDDSTAVATAIDGAVRATAEFHFAATGEVARITALRYRDENGVAVLTPFEARLWDYARREGVMVPMNAEVAWILAEGPFPYWRAGPERIEYDLRSEVGG